MWLEEVSFYQTTWHNIPEVSNLLSLQFWNIRSCMQNMIIGCIQITAWSRVLLEKLIVPQVISNISWFLWNLKLHYQVHKLLPPFSALSHTNVIHTHSSCFFNMHSNITLSMSRSWSLTLREEQWLRVFENRVLRRIFGPKRDKITREWRKLHNEEFYDLYSSPNYCSVIKSRRWDGWAFSVYGGKERHIQGFGGESWGKETIWKT